MRLRTAVVLLACLTACSSSPHRATPSPTGTTQAPVVLPVGTGPLALRTTTYLSPDGFVPPLALAVPSGWSSSARGDDGFELDQQGVRVVFLTPRDATSATALAGIRKAARGAVTSLVEQLAGVRGTGVEITGGTGPLARSPSGTVAVEAAPGRVIRVVAIDIDDVPLLVFIELPRSGSRLRALAQQLLAGVTPA